MTQKLSEIKKKITILRNDMDIDSHRFRERKKNVLYRSKKYMSFERNYDAVDRKQEKLQKSLYNNRSKFVMNDDSRAYYKSPENTNIKPKVLQEINHQTPINRLSNKKIAEFANTLITLDDKRIATANPKIVLKINQLEDKKDKITRQEAVFEDKENDKIDKESAKRKKGYEIKIDKLVHARDAILIERNSRETSPPAAFPTFSAERALERLEQSARHSRKKVKDIS